MNATKYAFTILLLVVAMVLAFLAGTATAEGIKPSAAEALTPGQWAAVQAANALLLDEGPVTVYLPIVLRAY
jgi:hypothetical protein